MVSVLKLMYDMVYRVARYLVNRELVSSVYSYPKLVKLLSRTIVGFRGSVTFILLFSIPFFLFRARLFRYPPVTKYLYWNFGSVYKGG